MSEGVLDSIQKVMAVQSSANLVACEKERTEDAGGKSRFGLVDVLIGEMGGFSVAMGAVKTAAGCAEKLFPENEKYQKFARVVGSSIPMLMTAHKSLKIIQNYYHQKRRAKKPVIDEENFILSHIMEVNMDTSYVTSMVTGKRLRPVIEWMQGMPNTKSISSIVMFDNDFNPVDDVKKRKESLSCYYIVYEFKCEDGNIRFVLKCGTDLLGEFVADATVLYDGTYFWEFLMVLMNYAYIDSLDYKDNIITIRESIELSPRRSIDHEVYQLEDSLRKEVHKSIDKKKKRGYAIAGLPGTGKSTMVDKIVDEFRDIPAISIPCESHIECDIIRNALVMSQLVSPCIVIFEDIDSLPLGDKHSPHLATFIEFLDSAKYDKPVIFIATMNEPENIHESLMDRRGRFDRIILVDPPSKRGDIMDVMSNVYRREFGEDIPEGMLDDRFFNIVSKCGMRHSDYAEVINRVMINDMPLVSESFTTAAKEIMDTQSNIDNFKGRRKRHNDSDREFLEDLPVEFEDCKDEEEIAVDYDPDTPGGVSCGVGIQI